MIVEGSKNIWQLVKHLWRLIIAIFTELLTFFYYYSNPIQGMSLHGLLTFCSVCALKIKYTARGL